MSHLKNTGFADRITAAAEAKKAMLAKLKPKPTVTDPNFDQREAVRQAELDAECLWLKENVYGQRRAVVQIEVQDARVRFSSRAGVVSQMQL